MSVPLPPGAATSGLNYSLLQLAEGEPGAKPLTEQQTDIYRSLTYSPQGNLVAAGDQEGSVVLIGPIEHELRSRVHVTSLDDVEIVPAQLGVWAGSIGAAVHGAEMAAAT